MWIVRIDDIEVESDDFTIEELGEVERASGEAWSMVNPYRSTKAATAFLAVALLRSGLSQEAAAQRLEKVTLRDLKTAFDFKPEDQAGGAGQAPLDRTSRASSRGGRGKAGSRPKRDNSE